MIFTLKKKKKNKNEINTNIILVSEIIYFRSFSLTHEEDMKQNKKITEEVFYEFFCIRQNSFKEMARSERPLDYSILKGKKQKKKTVNNQNE